MEVRRSDDAIVALRKIADRLEDLLTQDISNSTMVSEWDETDRIHKANWLNTYT